MSRSVQLGELLLRRRTERRVRTRRLRRTRRALITLVSTVIVLVATGTGTVNVELTSIEAHVPSAKSFPADSMVYDRNGVLLADIHEPGLSRIPVPLSGISPLLIDATISVEDKNFWNEGAVDYERLVSAGYQDINGTSNLQGASTITMQLAKLLYLTDTRTLKYKLDEIAYAEYLSGVDSKDTILDQYLNDVFYGNGSEGIEAAARIYFGIPASELTLPEAALLAGLPNSPTYLDPLVDPASAKARQLVVLDAMVTNRQITKAQSRAAYLSPLPYASSNMDNYDLVPFFVSMVENQVNSSLGLNAETAGLTITSTLNDAMQQYAQQDVNGTVAGLRNDYNLTDAALVSIDPQNGQVLAYVGNAGADVPGADYDMASTPRQVGSSFKLFTYTYGIQSKKISMVTPVLDDPISVPIGNGQFYQPVNYDFTWHGEVPLEAALGNSYNIPAVRVELVDGVSNVIEMAREMGVTTLNSPLSSYGPSATLGVYPVPLWQMAQAATVVANGGTLYPAQFVLSVTNAQGIELYTAPEPVQDVISPQTAFIMNNTLANNENREAEFGYDNLLEVNGHAVAAKTGTSDDFKDNYTIGWTPNLLTAVWAGNVDDAPMRNAIGITGAGPIWNLFMTHELGNSPDDWPSAPPGVEEVPSDSYYDDASAYVYYGTSSETNQNILLGGEACTDFYDQTFCYNTYNSYGSHSYYYYGN